jgi:hypothetical protein
MTPAIMMTAIMMLPTPGMMMLGTLTILTPFLTLTSSKTRMPSDHARWHSWLACF